MSIYCDTSLLVAALLRESASDRVHGWLARQDTGSLFISDWTATEMASALAMKLRSRELSVEQRAEALASWTIFRNASLVTLNVMPDNFATAAAYLESADLGLRAGDALHLAVASAHGYSIATLDSLQGKAAVRLGIPREKV